MEYIHVKNIEKYHPNYKDRNLIWCKVYFTMVNADPSFEMLTEIDKWRFIAFIMLEIQYKQPIPLDEGYLKRKGFDLKKRPIHLTLKMLHNFIKVSNIVSVDSGSCNITSDQQKKPRDVEVEVDKEVEVEVEKNNECVTQFMDYFNLKTNKNLSLTEERKKIIKDRLSKYALNCLKTAVDNFITDDWPDRHKYCDVIYCIGIRNKIDNLEKWLNYKQKGNYTQAQIKTAQNWKEFEDGQENI